MSFDINCINPYIRVAMNSALYANSVITQRVIFDYELIYLAKGKFHFIYNGCKYECFEGQFIFIRPGIPHSFHCDMGEIQQPHFHFDMCYSENSQKIPVSFKDLKDFSPYERLLINDDIFNEYPTQPFVTFKNKEKALMLFYDIINSSSSRLLSKKANLLKLTEMLIADNFPNFISQSAASYSIARQLKDYIDAGQGYQATLDDFENLFSYSKFHLEREFKKQYGVGIMAYRNNKRMDIAEKLLQTHSVSATTEKLGYSSIYVFSRAFKLHFGTSPSSYKKNLQNRKTGK